MVDVPRIVFRETCAVFRFRNIVQTGKRFHQYGTVQRKATTNYSARTLIHKNFFKRNATINAYKTTYCEKLDVLSVGWFTLAK